MRNEKGHFVKGLAPWNKGIPQSDEVREKISKKKKGVSPSKDLVEKIRQGQLKRVKEGRHNNYKGGISKNIEYRNWQKNQWHRRRRAADGSHTFEEWENLKAQYNWTCPGCNARESETKLSQDHIIPLSKGGSDNIENIQPLCIKCNMQKHTKTIKY